MQIPGPLVLNETMPTKNIRWDPVHVSLDGSPTFRLPSPVDLQIFPGSYIKMEEFQTEMYAWIKMVQKTVMVTIEKEYYNYDKY